MKTFPNTLTGLAAAAVLAVAQTVSAAPGDGEQPAAAADAQQPADLQSLPIERMQSEASRQLALLETLTAIHHLLLQLQSAGPDLMVLLDEDLPQAERMRAALSIQAGQAAAPVQISGIDSLREEVQVLRTLVEGMNTFRELPVQDVPEPLPIPAEDAPDTEWNLAHHHVKYVQHPHPDAGLDGYVAIGTGADDVVVGPGEQAVLGGKEVYLASIERDPAGQTRLNFLVDRVPAVIAY